MKNAWFVKGSHQGEKQCRLPPMIYSSGMEDVLKYLRKSDDCEIQPIPWIP